MTIDDRAAKKAASLWLKIKAGFTGNWHIDLDDQAIIVNAVAAELREAYADYDNLSKKSAHWYKSWEESQQEIEKLKSVLENLEQFLDFVLVVYDAREKELDKAYAEIERFKTMSTVEMMCENLNVKHHVEEWERRCLKAESEIARLRAALQKSAGFKVDRCSCVFIDDEPTLECGYHQTLRAELREAYAEIEKWHSRAQGQSDIADHVGMENSDLKAEIARLRAELQKSAGFKVDRCACVFVDDEPSLECGYHQTLRAELASIEQFAESWPCHCGENYPGATMYHGQDCQTAVAVEFVAQWRAAKVKP